MSAVLHVQCVASLPTLHSVSKAPLLLLQWFGHSCSGPEPQQQTGTHCYFAGPTVNPCCRTCVMRAGLSLAHGLGMSSEMPRASTQLLEPFVGGVLMSLPHMAPQMAFLHKPAPGSPRHTRVPLLPGLLGQTVRSLCKTQTAIGHSDHKVIRFI